MIPVLYPDEVAAFDRRIIDDVGISEDVLIENAAQSLYTALEDIAREAYVDADGPVLILCGPGNNGADGIALARHLAGAGRPVSILLCRDESSMNEQCRRQLRICRSIPEISIAGPDDLQDSGHFDVPIIVDAMLGTGATGELRSPFGVLVDNANRSEAIRIAADIPTGLDGITGRAGSSCFVADVTVTMGGVKPGLLFGDGPDYVGELWLSNLSLPSSFYSASTFLLDQEVAQIGIPTLQRRDHKYDRGNLLVVAGSRRMTGAAALAAWGGLHAGAGLVTVAIPHEAHDGLRPLLPPEIMTLPLPSQDGWFTPDSFGPLEERLDGFSAIVTGPGVGRSDAGAAFLHRLAGRSTSPIVLDADAISEKIIEAAVEAREEGSPVVVTPHHGEMARLIDRSSDSIAGNPIGVAREVADSKRVIVVLKGAPTVLSSAGRTYVNSVGNEGMATAGAGDVLSGVVGGLISGRSGGDYLHRVATAVWCHSRAADIAVAEGVSMPALNATAIGEYVGHALGEL